MSRRILGVALGVVLVGAVAAIAVAGVTTAPGGPFTGCLSNKGQIYNVALDNTTPLAPCTKTDKVVTFGAPDGPSDGPTRFTWHFDTAAANICGTTYCLDFTTMTFPPGRQLTAVSAQIDSVTPSACGGANQFTAAVYTTAEGRQLASLDQVGVPTTPATMNLASITVPFLSDLGFRVGCVGETPINASGTIVFDIGNPPQTID